jgi:hypothetical protein
MDQGSGQLKTFDRSLTNQSYQVNSTMSHQLKTEPDDDISGWVIEYQTKAKEYWHEFIQGTIGSLV